MPWISRLLIWYEPHSSMDSIQFTRCKLFNCKIKRRQYRMRYWTDGKKACWLNLKLHKKLFRRINCLKYHNKHGWAQYGRYYRESKLKTPRKISISFWILLFVEYSAFGIFKWSRRIDKSWFMGVTEMENNIKFVTTFYVRK